MGTDALMIWAYPQSLKGTLINLSTIIKGSVGSYHLILVLEDWCLDILMSMNVSVLSETALTQVQFMASLELNRFYNRSLAFSF